MSESPKTVSSSLPDDIETKVRNVQSDMIRLDAQKDSLTKDIAAKLVEQKRLSGLIDSANIELSRVQNAIESKQKESSEREIKLSQKESALNVYANALQEKEEKIKKYLAIFERMKDVVTK
jgi:uncharacterized protein (DUF3084 family)